MSELSPVMGPRVDLGVAEAPRLGRVDINGALDYEAPFVIEKLKRQRIVEDDLGGQALFLEVKRYLALSALARDQRFPMISSRVDQAWHEFVLFTLQYTQYCSRYLGMFMHHAPRESPVIEGVPSEGSSGALNFIQSYEKQFGPIPEVWSDEVHLKPQSRLRWSRDVSGFEVSEREGRAILCSAETEVREYCRVNLRAGGALRFIANNRDFLVRELPGLADSDEQMALCHPLVRYRVLEIF